ncbi:MAG: DNA methyltransferase [Patescibacteria group bacterium]
MQIIDFPIKPQKQQQWHWRIHPYFTKQASNVVREYVRNFSNEGDIVLDPFCGTGVTLIEALTLKRRAIGVDLSPLAVFITRETCIASIDLQNLDKEFLRIEKEIFPLVKFVREAKQNEIDKYEIKEWYPKGVKLPSNSDFEFVEDLFDKKQLIVYAKLLFLINNIKDFEIKELFRLIFSNTLGKANLTYMDNVVRGPEGGGPSIFGKYRYWRPKKSVIIDVWKNFSQRYKNIKVAKQESNKLFGQYFKEPQKNFFKENATFWAIKESATNLSKFLPPESVDYIYTDPPYGAHIAYLDLSTMWNAWLDFPVLEEDRKLEAIEGGELKKSKENYIDLIFESIAEMAKVLKKGKYLSIVFQHKDVAFWNMIQESCQKAGFNYVNTVYQPTNTTSIHKKKNPLMVMGSQLILNFQRSDRVTISGIKLKDESQIEKIILDTAERVVVDKGGLATTEDIYAQIVPNLLEAGLLHVANRQYKDLMPILEKHFELDSSGFWQIKKGTILGQHIDRRKKIEYFVRSALRKNNKMKLEEIIGAVFPNLTNGSTPTQRELMEILKEIAEPADEDEWRLKKEEKSTIIDLIPQQKLSLFGEPLSEHNKTIYSLLKLANKIGLIGYVGKNEQKDPSFEGLQYLKKLPIKKLTNIQKKRIEQIDCIWFHHDGTPAFAFEVEESTSILSALERFWALLEVSSELGKDKRLLLIIPKSRERKARQELTGSSYIGHPQFLEQKTKYIFKEDFFTRYLQIFNTPKASLKDIDTLGRSFSYLEK